MSDVVTTIGLKDTEFTGGLTRLEAFVEAFKRRIAQRPAAIPVSLTTPQNMMGFNNFWSGPNGPGVAGGAKSVPASFGDRVGAGMGSAWGKVTGAYGAITGSAMLVYESARYIDNLERASKEHKVWKKDLDDIGNSFLKMLERGKLATDPMKVRAQKILTESWEAGGAMDALRISQMEQLGTFTGVLKNATPFKGGWEKSFQYASGGEGAAAAAEAAGDEAYFGRYGGYAATAFRALWKYGSPIGWASSYLYSGGGGEARQGQMNRERIGAIAGREAQRQEEEDRNAKQEADRLDLVQAMRARLGEGSATLDAQFRRHDKEGEEREKAEIAEKRLRFENMANEAQSLRLRGNEREATLLEARLKYEEKLAEIQTSGAREHAKQDAITRLRDVYDRTIGSINDSFDKVTYPGRSFDWSQGGGAVAAEAATAAKKSESIAVDQLNEQKRTNQILSSAVFGAVFQ